MVKCIKPYPKIKQALPTLVSQVTTVSGALIGGVSWAGVDMLGKIGTVVTIASIAGIAIAKAEAQTKVTPDPQFKDYLNYMEKWIQYASKELQYKGANLSCLKMVKTFTGWKKSPGIYI